jgi:D-alanine--D-alanine ligase
MIMGKMRVGVLMGGMSIEQEVSFNSGRTVCDHLDITRYVVVPIFQRHDGALYILPYRFLHRGKITDFLDRLQAEATCIQWDNLAEQVDFIYIATHGRYAEDGTLQGMLEVLGIPYLGSTVFASAVCMDKLVQKKILGAHGITTPRGIALTAWEVAHFDALGQNMRRALADNNLDLPLVVKPHKEGSSLGVHVVTAYEQLKDAVMAACYITPEYPQTVLLEEKIAGMEFSCISIRDHQNACWITFPPTEIVPEEGSLFFDYTQKYMPGRAHKFTPPRCSDTVIRDIQETCRRVNDLLDIKTISRIDGFVQPDGTVVIVDPNTLSGMGPASFLFREAAEHNMGHSHLINHLIETELCQRGIMHYTDMATTVESGTDREAAKKTRVAILFGGDSNEKEISLESGRNVLYKLSPHCYEALPIFVTSAMKLYQINQSLLVRSSTAEIESLLDRATPVLWSDLPAIADFVFIALHGGKGENGAVQGTLEMLQMPYNGSSVLASALCMDKYRAAELFRADGITMPRQLLIAKNRWLDEKAVVMEQIKEQIGFPAIIKPHDDGCSVLVQRADDCAALEAHMAMLFCSAKEYALVEECIIGTELTIGVIGNNNPRALPPSQAVASAGILSIEEKFLPGAGQNITPALLPADALALAQHTVEQAYKTAGCVGYARIDCFYQSATQSPTGTERVVILEINTLPGLTPATCIFHQAAEVGMSPMSFIDLIVQLGFVYHAKQGQEPIFLNKESSLLTLVK